MIRQKKNEELFIIIPVHNRANYTEKCLESLFNQSNKNFEIVLVDDGSEDNTFEMVKEKFPQAICLKGDGNWWWTKSINVGFRNAIKYITRIYHDNEQ